MATPALSHHVLPGALGEILVDVRAGSADVPQPAVLLLHGFKGFKDFAFIPPFADRLARSGFVAVNASVSGCGVDASGEFNRLDRFEHNTWSRELDDLNVVLEALRTGGLGVAPPSDLAVVGHSKGGAAALLLAGENDDIAAVVTWSAIAQVRRNTDEQLDSWRSTGTLLVHHGRLGIDLPLAWEVAQDAIDNEFGRLDIASTAAALGRPWLQVHGTADETVPFSEAEQLALAGDTDHHAFLAIEGASHTYGAAHPWSGTTPHLDRVFDATTTFLSRHVGS